MVLQQDQQIRGHFDISCVAHLRLQIHHNEDKKRYPSCDEKNSIFLISLILNRSINKIALRYGITLRENKQYPSRKGA